jgi:hypothetical protein
MRDPFKASQFPGFREPHVKTVNGPVERLRESAGGWVPYVVPIHGGSVDRILSILRDPGPMAHETRRSGMLCVENDDDSAALPARTARLV